MRKSHKPTRISSCRHRANWLVALMHFEWCYRCGAMRQMKQTGNAACVPDSVWLRPIGSGENHLKSWENKNIFSANANQQKQPKERNGIMSSKLNPASSEKRTAGSLKRSVILRPETPLQEAERMKKIMTQFRKLALPSRDLVIWLQERHKTERLPELKNKK